VSVAEHEENEQDYCEPHGNERPCWLCKREREDERLDRRER
jgi:hypothetical protein